MDSPVFGSNGKPIVFWDSAKNDAYQAELNRQFQRDERLAAQDFNIEMWNMNNAYNEKLLAEQREYDSPANQLKLMKQAGINPNSFNGSPTRTNPSFSSPVTTHGSSGSSAHGASFASDLLGLVNGVGNIANNTFSAIKSVAEKRNIDSLTNLNNQEIKYNDITFDTRVKRAEKEVDEITENINKSISSRKVDESNVELNNVTAEQIRAGIPYIAQKQQADIDIALETAKKVREEVSLIKEQKSELKKNGLYDRGLKSAQTSYYKSLDDVNTSNAKVATSTEDERIAKEEYEAALLKLKSEFSKSMGVPLDVPEFQFFWYLNQNGLLEQYVKDVQGSIVKQTKGIEKQIDMDNQLLRTLLEFSTLFLSKGKVRAI